MRARNRPRAARLCAAILPLILAAPSGAPASPLSIELRGTPILLRPNRTPSLCGLLTLALGEHWLVGGGYELVQDYDAVLWSSAFVGHKPIVMSGVRTGAWYRGGAEREGAFFAAGSLVTFANRAISLETSPRGLDNQTWVADLGGDLVVGYVWDAVRLGVYATPAWSYGRIVSPAIHKTAHYSAFTYRMGLTLAVRLGS